ncbi:MAG TPA: amino acid adenylation domain-containing protein, partial [Longimicrobium sp.]|uniref:amino acid adenylation domain-containing protein n=1 Tax=Longimicrobium sp. TaxID=2029185 RepID=UPI002ED9605D
MTVPPRTTPLSREEKQALLRRRLVQRISQTRAEATSFAQERLWFLERMNGSSALYNVPDALRLRGVLDAAALESAVGEIIRRHESLRTTFREVDGGPVQVIAPFAGFSLPRDDLSALPADAREARAHLLAAEDAALPFDLEQGPLLRARLLRLAGDDHVLLLCMHHVVTDGWSMGVFYRELSALYTAYAAGAEPALAPLPLQYAEYAAEQRGRLTAAAMDRELAWWRERLAGAPALLELPTDHPRPAAQSYRGAREAVEVPAEVTERLQALARAEGASLYMVVLAAFQVLLGRYADTDDVVVGSPIAGRTRPEVEGLIGFFVNTLVLRTDLSGDPGFRELLRRVRAATLGAYAHQEVPFERLVAEVQPERSLGHAPLFQALLTLDEAGAETEALPGLTVSRVKLETGTAKFDLALALAQNGNGLSGELVYASDLFGAATIRRMAAHLGRVLEQVAADADVRLSGLELADAAERAQLQAWNRTAAEYPAQGTLHTLFAERAAATPEAVAVACGGETLTYAELHVRASALACHLARTGVRPGDRVGLALERSLEVPVALLATLQAGAAYVPLDATYPPERLAGMLADAAVSVLVVRDGLPGSLSGFAGPVVVLEHHAEAIAACRGEPLPQAGVTADSEAYVMFTSGSTGRPKGVGVPHRAVVRLVRGTGFADFGPEQVFLQIAPLSFDASTLEIWGPLLNGGRLVMFPPHAPSLEELGAALEEYGVTVLWLTAGLFHQMVDLRLESLGGLRQLLAGGDVLSPAHVLRVLERYPALRLTNGYGPTENTTFTCCHDIRPEDARRRSIPIGRPIANTRVWVLDAGMRPVPVGVPGELCTAGDGLALGYVGRAELTAQKFVEVELHGRRERVYRTGDRVRWLEDGTLEFMGRLDGQVKLRGFRIELGEIESVLRGHAAVRDCVVVMREDAPGEKRLVAYVVGEADAAALRACLRLSVPEYMVPSAFVLLDALPLTPNGKLDRKALPEPDRASESEGYVAPRTPAEEVLAGLFAELLRVERVGRGDDFFALGGHSLLATRVASRVRAIFGVELPLRDVFAGGTPARLAQRVEALRRAGVPALAPMAAVERTDALPLSFAQERLWVLDRMEPGSALYNVPSAMRLRGALDAGALERALGEIVRRHEALRTVFREGEGGPVQVIVPLTGFVLPVEDLSALEAASREAELARLADADAMRPFDLAAGPLFRATLLRLADDEHVLLLCIHHIASDGWSMGVLYRELSALYGAYQQGGESPLPE